MVPLLPGPLGAAFEPGLPRTFGSFTGALPILLSFANAGRSLPLALGMPLCELDREMRAFPGRAVPVVRKRGCSASCSVSGWCA